MFRKQTVPFMPVLYKVIANFMFQLLVRKFDHHADVLIQTPLGIQSAVQLVLPVFVCFVIHAISPPSLLFSPPSLPCSSSLSGSFSCSLSVRHSCLRFPLFQAGCHHRLPQLLSGLTPMNAG